MFILQEGEKAKMYDRTLSIKIIESAKKNPVIALTGPRQSGKTYLVKHLFSEYEYVNLEDPDTRDFAIDDPRGFLSQFESRVIIDEAQKVPSLFSFIQGIVDEKQMPGQFVLTGSQNFLLMENISQSLAGRTAIFNLLPLSCSEIFSRKGVDIFRPEYLNKKIEHDLFETIFNGFFPRIHDKKLNTQEWLADYVQTYIEKDVRTISKIGDLETFRRFLSLCAGRCGHLLDMVSLGNDCGISHTTVKRWLSILQTSFQIFLLQPYFRNFNKRIIKSPKLYFFDTGLLCYLLRIRNPKDLVNHPSKGAIFESFIISEYYKKFINQKMVPDIFYWRDSSGNEVDLIIENGQNQIPVEIKSGQTFNASFTKGVNYWRKLANSKEGMIYYGGNKSFTYKDNKVFSWYEI